MAKQACKTAMLFIFLITSCTQAMRSTIQENKQCPESEIYKEPQKSFKQFLPEPSNDYAYFDMPGEVIDAADTTEYIKVPTDEYKILAQEARRNWLTASTRILEHINQHLPHYAEREKIKFLKNKVMETSEEKTSNNDAVDVTENDIVRLLPYLQYKGPNPQLYPPHYDIIIGNESKCFYGTITQIIYGYQYYVHLLKKGWIRCDGAKEQLYRPRDFNGARQYFQWYGPRFRLLASK